MDISPGRPLRLYRQDGQFVDMSTDELVGRKLNDFKDWLCGMGVQSLHVDMDGDVYGASCRVLGKLGNVFTEFTIPQDWVKCPRELCSCGADLFIPKARTERDLPLLRKTYSQPRQFEQQLETIAPGELAGIERTHASAEKQIYWEIGRRCNYNCSYCWPWIHNNHEKHKTLADLLSATNRILTLFAGTGKVNFIISGGEPTLNPDFLDWVRYISAMGHTLSMHSNGSRLPDYYRELIQYGNLNLSAHFEFWNRDRFVRVVEAVTDEKVQRKNAGVGHLEIKLMMAPGRRTEALELEDRLKAIPEFINYCTWAFVPIRDGNMGDQVMKGYEPEDFKLFGEGVV